MMSFICLYIEPYGHEYVYSVFYLIEGESDFLSLLCQGRDGLQFNNINI